jgi:hypothetical protein
VLCVLALAGMLVAFTGCGGDDKKSSSEATTTESSGGGDSGSGSLADYKAGFIAAGTKFQNAAQDAAAKAKSAPTAEGKLAGLDALKQTVTTAADDFEKLNPPSNLKADNGELVTELRGLASTIDETKTATQQKDQATLANVRPKLAQTQAQIGQTLVKIQSKLGSS